MAAIPIASVTAGHDYSVACSSTGQLYTWGAGHTGVLGHVKADDE